MYLPDDPLRNAVRRWRREICMKSPGHILVNSPVTMPRRGSCRVRQLCGNRFSGAKKRGEGIRLI